jgi:hypothetical protein
LRCGRDESVAHHDFQESCSIRWSTRVDDGGDVTEVLLADIRCHHHERARRLRTGIAEVVYNAQRSRHPFARSQVARVLADRIPEHAGQHIDTFFVIAVAMRRGHVSAGRHAHLEESQPAVLGTIDEVADLQLPDIDDVTIHGNPLRLLRIEAPAPIASFT